CPGPAPRAGRGGPPSGRVDVHGNGHRVGADVVHGGGLSTGLAAAAPPRPARTSTEQLGPPEDYSALPSPEAMASARRTRPASSTSPSPSAATPAGLSLATALARTSSRWSWSSRSARSVSWVSTK